MRGSIGFVRAIQVTCILAYCLVLVGCGGSKISKSNYDKIKGGMTLKQVEEILGRSDAASRPEMVKAMDDAEKLGDGEGELVAKAWRTGDSIIVVYFRDAGAIAKGKHGF